MKNYEKQMKNYEKQMKSYEKLKNYNFSGAYFTEKPT